MSQPANYHVDRLRAETDGYFYKVITEGGDGLYVSDHFPIYADLITK